jgi:cell division protein FtsX
MYINKTSIYILLGYFLSGILIGLICTSLPIAIRYQFILGIILDAIWLKLTLKVKNYE